MIEIARVQADIDARNPTKDQYTGKPVPLDQKEQRPPELLMLIVLKQSKIN